MRATVSGAPAEKAVRVPLRPFEGKLRSDAAGPDVSALPVPSIGPPDRGITPPSRAAGHEGFLSDVIVELGFADRPTVERAVSAARSPGATVAGVLVEMGAITEEQLAHARAERHGLLYVDLEVYDVDPSAANLLTPAAARQHGCVPIGFAGPRLVLAVADPADAHGAVALPALEGRKILPAVATAAALEQLTERLPLPQPAGDLEVVDDPPDEQVEAQPAPAAPEPREMDTAEEEYELRARLSKAETRLDEALVRSREHHRELATARMEVEARTMELEVLRTKLTDTESDAIRARAEAEHSAHEERTLRARLDTEARRRRVLEERISKLETELFAAERAGQEQREAQARMRAALSGPDEP